MESNGLKLEVLRDKPATATTASQAGGNKQPTHADQQSASVKFRLKLVDKTKRKANWPVWSENEEIEIIFDMRTDDAEQIVKELKEKTNKISDEDIRYLTQAIKDKCLVLKLEREDRLEEETLAAGSLSRYIIPKFISL